VGIGVAGALVSNERNGPKLTVVASCRGCKHERAQHFETYDGACSAYDCMHPAVGCKRLSFIETPKWCPMLDEATDALIVSLRQ
jgi:hypothetical protein